MLSYFLVQFNWHFGSFLDFICQIVFMLCFSKGLLGFFFPLACIYVSLPCPCLVPAEIRRKCQSPWPRELQLVIIRPTFTFLHFLHHQSLFNSFPLIYNHLFIFLFCFLWIWFSSPFFSLHLNVDGKIIMGHCLLFRYRNLNYHFEIYIYLKVISKACFGWPPPHICLSLFLVTPMICSSSLVIWVCWSWYSF